MTDYSLLIRQLEALLPLSPHPVSAFANAAALIYDSLEGLNWCGFYFMLDGALALGPFCGKPACTRIPVGKGVCGTAVKEGKTQLVYDVHEFPGHIACDSASNSELVIPLRRNGEIIGVLDLDSPYIGRFAEEDKAGLESAAEIISQYAVIDGKAVM